MSWDFGMEVDVGGDCPISLGGGYDDFRANYTYNVSPMFYEAFKGLLDEGINGLHGMLGKDARPMIETAIRRMQAAPKKYQKWNPDNGWGNYEGALNLLCILRGWCIAAPLGRIAVG